MPATATDTPREALPATPPAPGTEVAYCLRPDGEWLPATVVDEVDGKPLEGAEWEDGGRLHLAVKVSKSRHHAARDTAYRYNVPYGSGSGQWLLSKPADADAVFAAAEAERAMRDRITREQMARVDDRKRG